MGKWEDGVGDDDKELYFWEANQLWPVPEEGTAYLELKGEDAANYKQTASYVTCWALGVGSLPCQVLYEWVTVND